MGKGMKPRRPPQGPKEGTPAKAWKAKAAAATDYNKTGKFGSKKLPSGTITQHRMKAGITSPQ